MMRFRSAAKAAIVFLFLLSQLQGLVTAQDWPQWRGPGRDGIIPAFTEPKAWPDHLKQKWQISVGTGHSSPLLMKQKVYLFTRQGEQEVVSCINFETGKQIWRNSYSAPYTMNSAATRHGKGPKSTPVLQAGKLVTLGISGILSCYDAENGKLLWRREFGSQFSSTSPLYGTATSPMVERGVLITHVGGDDSGALTALDLETGKTVWSWNGDGPSYASPIIADLAGTRQIVTQSQKNLIGVSVSDGRLLWSIPFTTAWVQNIITPIAYGQTLIFSGLDKGVMAIKLAQSGGKWNAERVWENTDASFYMSTPVLKGDLLLGFSHKNRGRFVALDARTGKTLWATAGREGDNAAVLTSGDKLFLLTSDAELILAKANSSGLEQLRRYSVAQSPTWAHPVLAGKHILVKDAESLTLWSLD
jgi:outer membrane protein assembly factor BamB